MDLWRGKIFGKAFNDRHYSKVCEKVGKNSTIQRRKNAIVVMQGFVGIVKLRVKFKTIVRGMVCLQSKYRMAKEKTLRH